LIVVDSGNYFVVDVSDIYIINISKQYYILPNSFNDVYRPQTKFCINKMFCLAQTLVIIKYTYFRFYMEKTNIFI